jgi:hypothetical protein
VSSASLDDVRLEPSCELVAIQFARSHLKNDSLLLVHWRAGLKTVQDEKDFHRRMARALIAVDEGTALDEREAKGGRLFGNRWIEAVPPKVMRG